MKGQAVAPDAELEEARELAREIARCAAEKKARDIVALEVGATVSYTDFFVIATGATTRQTKAIAADIVRKLRAQRRPARTEGEREGEWILMDFGDVVVHVFTPVAREFYRLETLWGDVPRLPLPEQA